MPHTRIRRTLTPEADSPGVRIMDRGEVVAEHMRCWDKHQVVGNPDHPSALRRHKRKARLYLDAPDMPAVPSNADWGIAADLFARNAPPARNRPPRPQAHP